MKDDNDLSVISVLVHSKGIKFVEHFSGAVGFITYHCVVAFIRFEAYEDRSLIPFCVGGGFKVRVHSGAT